MSQAMLEMVRQQSKCDDQLNLSAALYVKAKAMCHRLSAIFAGSASSWITILRCQKINHFPPFEKATGMTDGPTVVMPSEHVEIRARHGAAAIKANQSDQALAAMDTLHALKQQHRVKEENVLYPRCEGSAPQLMSVLGCGPCSDAFPLAPGAHETN